MPPAWISPSRLHGLKRICTYRVFFAVGSCTGRADDGGTDGDVNSRPEPDPRRDGFVDRLVGKKLISNPMQVKLMSNKEFDNIKQELMWEGSSFVMLSSNEQKCLEASVSYMDESKIVLEGPRCSLHSNKKVKVIRRMSRSFIGWIPDYAGLQ
ncbi:hypothetical protein DY000_02018389 [Brassica cretica]|uniref:Uncharacterized protein n=1 Tax=Brassica cretica TaxID=69181 RepID=A0ABQ7D3P3_BRACR|nr:hypothetical protein DY000_02018389 [Brassica cretica]